MTESKKKRLRAIQEERLKMFEGDFHQEKKVGDEWYIKSWNGGTERWQVAMFSELSYKKYKSFELKKDNEKEVKPMDPNFIRPTLENIKKLTKSK